jgi:uncharacterized protein with HEPN domain
MKKNDHERIFHIKTYCEDIAQSIKRFGDSFDVFSNDVDYFNSVSMSIMQIGELSVGLSDKFKNTTRTQVQWEQIKGMRNRFAHAYTSMIQKDIWETAIRDIPILLHFCNSVLEKDANEQAKAKKPKDHGAR